MQDEPRPKSHYRASKTLHAFQRRGEVIKPAELIEVRGGEKITLAARRIYSQLLSNAFGPEMAAEGQEYRISFSELRGNHTSNDRKRRRRSTCFQLDGLKFQGSRSPILACG